MTVKRTQRGCAKEEKLNKKGQNREKKTIVQTNDKREQASGKPHGAFQTLINTVQKQLKCSISKPATNCY